jgi:hypothetical protein
MYNKRAWVLLLLSRLQKFLVILFIRDNYFKTLTLNYLRNLCPTIRAFRWGKGSEKFWNWGKII